MKNVIISGSSGLVGSRIIELLKGKLNFIPLTIETTDITDKDSVERFFEDKEFDSFLHLAAYTNVNGAEMEKDTAFKINVDGTKNVFEAVKNRGKEFIYISTDFVFSGENKEAVNTEDTIPHPSGVYGKTKYEGEKIVKDKGMILRISYPFRAQFVPKRDFVTSIKSVLERDTKISAVTDSLITPTFIDDIAQAMHYLINNFRSEIYHIVGQSILSPYEAVKTIADKFGLNKSLVTPTTYSTYYKEYATIRPQYSATKSIKNNFYKMLSFEQSLEEIIQQLN